MRWLLRDVASGATRGTVRGDFVEVTLMLVCVLLVGISACFLGWFWGYHFYGLSNCVQPLQFFENPWVPMDIDIGFQGFGFDSGPNLQPWVVLFVSWARKTKLAANVGRFLSQTRWRVVRYHKIVIIISTGKKHLFKNKQLESPLDNQIF